jgi:hypothetical protein
MRPITVTVGPLAAALNNAIGIGTPANGGSFNLNGNPPGGSNVSAFLGNCVITNGVLTVNSTTSGAMGGGLRLTGVGVQAGTAVLGPGPTPGTWRVYPTQTVAAVVMRGNTVITLDAPRQITISTTEPAGNSVTVVGTDAAGNPISETVATTGAAITTQQNFATVTQVYVANPSGLPFTIGTSAGTATSPWVMFDPWATPASITKQATLTGAATFSVQISNDDPNAPGGPPPGGMTWSNDPDATFVGATTPVEGSWAFVPLYARVLLTAGAGAVRMTFAQQGSP